MKMLTEYLEKAIAFEKLERFSSALLSSPCGGPRGGLFLFAENVPFAAMHDFGHGAPAFPGPWLRIR